MAAKLAITCLQSVPGMTTTVQCNVGCHWVDAGVQCDLGYPRSLGGSHQ